MPLDIIVVLQNHASLRDIQLGDLVMELGSFSVSLSVKDIEASRDFYSKLGFESIGGNLDENWLILRN